MTPTEQWMMGLALVYAVPSFLSGVGITLLFVHWRDLHHVVVTMPDFFFPKSALERSGFKTVSLKTVSLAPTDESHPA